MALPFKKDLEKYKEIDEDEILNKLSEEELKQLENALEEMDPEVRPGPGVPSLPGVWPLGRNDCISFCLLPS